MSCGPKFHETRMGQRFYERTMPELVRQLERLNDLLEKQTRRDDAASDSQDREEPPRGQ